MLKLLCHNRNQVEIIENHRQGQYRDKFERHGQGQCRGKVMGRGQGQ